MFDIINDYYINLSWYLPCRTSQTNRGNSTEAVVLLQCILSNVSVTHEDDTACPFRYTFCVFEGFFQLCLLQICKCFAGSSVTLEFR